MSPDKTLETILKLIDNDVKLIQQNFKELQLDEKTALTLTRYATSLSGIKSDRRKEEEVERSKYSKLSTEEIEQLVMEEIEKKRRKE